MKPRKLPNVPGREQTVALLRTSMRSVFINGFIAGLVIGFGVSALLALCIILK